MSDEKNDSKDCGKEDENEKNEGKTSFDWLPAGCEPLAGEVLTTNFIL